MSLEEDDEPCITGKREPNGFPLLQASDKEALL
jgi:hypothetical protein